MWSWDEFANRAISLQISPALAGKEAHPAVAARVTSSVFLIRLFIETPRRLRRLLLAPVIIADWAPGGSPALAFADLLTFCSGPGMTHGQGGQALDS